MFGALLDEARKIVRSPRRLLQALHPRRWRQFFRILLFEARTGNRWSATAGQDSFQRRDYASYDQYVEHQSSKLQYLDLTEYDVNFRRMLQERFQKLDVPWQGAKVLCLGARQGTEVKAFRDLGCDAIGVDLNPGKDNPFVVQGDFHNLQFEAKAMDVIFTNSLDHVFDINKVIGEIKRVLRPGGWLIIEAIRGDREKSTPDHYASFWWHETGDLAALFELNGFLVTHRESFTEPWPGEQLCFTCQP